MKTLEEEYNNAILQIIDIDPKTVVIYLTSAVDSSVVKRKIINSFELIDSDISLQHHENRAQVVLEEFKLPSPFILPLINCFKLRFVQNSSLNRIFFEKHIESHHAKVSWPKPMDSSTVLECTCTLNKETPHAIKLSKEWQKVVLKEITNMYDIITVNLKFVFQVVELMK